MSKPTLEQVQKLAEQLSPEDRLQIWRHMAWLAGFGVGTEQVKPPRHSLKRQDAASNDWVILHSNTGTTVDALLKGRVIFQIFYWPENLKQSQIETVLSESELPPEELVQEIRTIFAEQGIEPPSDQTIIEDWRKAGQEITPIQTARISAEIALRLPDLTGLFVDGIIDLVKIALSNADAEKLGKKKATAKEIEKMLKGYWRHVTAAHLGITYGPVGRPVGSVKSPEKKAKEAVDFEKQVETAVRTLRSAEGRVPTKTAVAKTLGLGGLSARTGVDSSLNVFNKKLKKLDIDYDAIVERLDK